MAQDKIHIPASQGGLVRYFEESKSLIELKPEHALFLVVLIILLEIILHWYGAGWLGI
ncbi:preprotein translocase subunit Sec61beta [Candidatus Woesearchaeota archaeon]|nr:preprotein translocase subunit Sec61beta [Candidatus Woesearchaeota archaeon]